MTFILGPAALGIIAFAMAHFRAPLWVWASALAIVALTVQGACMERAYEPRVSIFILAAWLPSLFFGALCVPAVRRRILSTPVFHLIRRTLPKLPVNARETLGAGGVGFESEFFTGRPDWARMRAVQSIALTEKERSFIEGPTEDLCRMTDPWQIRHTKEIPEQIWSFLKGSGFLGLRIAEANGGLGFSAHAASLILGKVASRSADVFAIMMIPNSLGIGELIERHGTKQQRDHYLPRLAKGVDIPCLALTGPASGSDAASMWDVGRIARGSFQGENVIGIRLSWNKRYVTLAPEATLVGLAFHLFDPEGLLGTTAEIGITVAIVPATLPGVHIGRRHIPAGAAFSNGPTWGADVFIPLDWVIGGRNGLGRGWRMLMDSVAGSRAIAIPACAAAGAKSCLRVSTAYGRIRRQFGAPIARMEALEEPLARMVEAAYVSEAARGVTAAMVSRGDQPTVLSALLKYQTTSLLRRSVDDAMDLHGGRAIADGPANYLQAIYQMVPTTITIEGANIVTRALIGFTQAAFRSHPFVHRELDACQDLDVRRGLRAFDEAFRGHVAFSVGVTADTFLHNLVGGRLFEVPPDVGHSAAWHRQLRRASHWFAFMANLAVLSLGPAGLRKRQKLAGRLADALSELYLIACALKRFEDDGSPEDDRAIVAYSVRSSLFRIQEAIRGAIGNFPIAWARPLMRVVVFPFGLPYRPASDELGHRVVQLVLEPGPTRDRLTRDIYRSEQLDDPVGLLEMALQRVVLAEMAQTKVDRAVRRGVIRRRHGSDWIGDAVAKAIIDDGEAELLRGADALTLRAVAVDDFDPGEIRPNYMTEGHNARSMRDLPGFASEWDRPFDVNSSADGPAARDG